MYSFQSSDPNHSEDSPWRFGNLLSQRKAQRRGPVSLVRSPSRGGGERGTRALAPGPAFQHVFIEVQYTRVLSQTFSVAPGQLS